MEIHPITSLHAAAEYGYENILRDIFGPKLQNTRDYKTDINPVTSIHAAAEYGHEDVLREIIGLNLQDVNAKEKTYNRTPLHVAVSVNNYRISEILLENNCDIDAADSNGMTALHIAIGKRSQEIVGLLLDFGADVNTPHRFRGMTPLYMAVHYNCLAIVKMLLNKGASIEMATIGNRNVLDLAMKISHTMRRLLRSHVVGKMIEKNSNTLVINDYTYRRWSTTT